MVLHLRLCLTFAALLVTAPAYAQDSFREGQTWETPIEGAGVIISLIQKIEPYGNDTVIHITPIEYRPETGEMFVLAAHLPFEETAFRKSVSKFIGQAESDPSIYLEGYNIWKENEGGIFTITLTEAIPTIFGQIQGGQ